MVSNTTHEDDQIVVSKEVTPKNTHVANKSDLIDQASSSNNALSKNEEQMKSIVQHDDNNVENKGDEAEDLLMDLVCDTCGDQGWKKYLAICVTCNVGAEHSYCMPVKCKTIPPGWECYDCNEDNDQMRKNEICSKKKKGKNEDPFEMSESSQRQPDLLKTQNENENVGMHLNQDPIPDLNIVPIPDPNVDPIPDPNVDPIPDLPILDLFVDPIPDLNLDPNLDLDLIPDLNLDPNMNLDLTLGHTSYHAKRRRVNTTPSLS